MATDHWVECPECEGDEGHVLDSDVWVPCPVCLGEGGHVEEDR